MARFTSQLAVITPRRVPDTLRTIELETLPDAQFELIGIDSFLNKHSAYRLYRPAEVLDHLTRLKPDVVILEQEPYSLSSFQILRLKKKLGFKVILFSFQNIFKTYPPPFNWAEKYCLNAADLFLGGSGSVLPVWKKKGVRTEMMRVLAQVGVDLNEFFPMNSELMKAKFGLKGFVFGYAGRFVEEKGVHILIDAFAKTPFAEKAQLALVGRGPFEDELRRQCQQLNLTDRVHFISGLKHDQMPEVLNAFDVLVLPSLIRKHWREQFGHVIIEALACGKPVIGSDTEPIPEVMGPGGLAFREGDAEELAAALSRLFFEKDLYQNLSKKGMEFVTREFTNEVIAKKLCDFAQELAL